MSVLILVPTQGERDAIESLIDRVPPTVTIHTVGFGVISSAVETMRLIERSAPHAVILAGIAGAFESQVEGHDVLGSSLWASRVFIDGIGVGQGEAFVDAQTLGWQCTDALTCVVPAWADFGDVLTVCSGSADRNDAERRADTYPSVVAEEMEGYGVAWACKRNAVPFSMVRGFSNFVGRRDRTTWKVREALESVAGQLQRSIDQTKP